MKLGKVPPDLLEDLLRSIDAKDPRVLLGPKVGEDAALIDYGDRALVAKTDPITFATDLIGWYAVQVNANDVACAGAAPRWFLATLLLPQTVTPEQIREIFGQITDACRGIGATLVGGHTEVTRGIDHPIIVGCMLGEVAKDRMITTSGAQVGDSIVLTKGVSIEGTALLARERPEQLRAAGVDDATIVEAQGLLFDPGISVVRDARIACDAVDVHSLHDPTEGGLATGLREVASAAGVGLVIDADRIPVVPHCRVVCDALGLDPLGLLASGCLIAAVPKNQAGQLIDALAVEGISAWEIGRATPPEEGVLLKRGATTSPLPTFDRDELARYFEEEPPGA